MLSVLLRSSIVEVRQIHVLMVIPLFLRNSSALQGASDPMQAWMMEIGKQPFDWVLSESMYPQNPLVCFLIPVKKSNTSENKTLQFSNLELLNICDRSWFGSSLDVIG